MSGTNDRFLDQVTAMLPALRAFGRSLCGDMARADDLVQDSAAGLVMAHEDLLALNESPLFICRRTPKQGRVALISGGGSGHVGVLHCGLGALGRPRPAVQVAPESPPRKRRIPASGPDGRPGAQRAVPRLAGARR